MVRVHLDLRSGTDGTTDNVVFYLRTESIWAEYFDSNKRPPGTRYNLAEHKVHKAGWPFAQVGSKTLQIMRRP